MKKLLKSFVLVAAAAMALTSCENEAMNDGITTNDTYTLTFTADAPQSRTSVSVDENSGVANFTWKEKEEFVVIANTGGEISKADKVDFVKVGEKAQITATFNKAPAEGSTFVAVYPASAWVATSNTDFEKAKLALKGPDQALCENTYDPAADLMFSQAVEAQPNETTNLKFTRLASVAKMNLKLDGVTDGEIIKEVAFSIGATSTKLVGRYYANLATGELAEATPYMGNNNVVLRGELEAATGNNRTPIFFTCLPGEYSGAYEVTVTTDKAIYTNTGKSIPADKPLVFTAGDVLGFNLTTTTREEIDTTVDYSGKYFVVANGGTWWGMKYDSTANYRVATDSGKTEYTTYEDLGFTGEYVWNINKVEGNIYTIANHDSTKYLIATDANEATVGNNGESAQVTLTCEEGGFFTIQSVAQNTRYLQFNKNNTRFAFYKTSSNQNGKLYLVPVTGTIKSNLAMSFSATEVKLTVGDTFTAPTPTFNPAGTYAVTYTVTNTEGDIASVDGSGNVVVNTTAAGSAKVTAKFAGNDAYYPAEASYTITISEAEQGGGEAVETTYKVTNFNTELGFSGTGNVIDGKAYDLGSDLTLTGYKSTNSNAPGVNKDGTIRLYTNNYFVLASEKTIIKVVFTFAGSTYANITEVTPGTYDTTTYTWTGSANSITFKNTKSTQAQIKTMEVTYVSGNAGGDTPTDPETPAQPQDQTLTFSKAAETATVGQAFTAPTLSGAKTTVTYSSSNTAVAIVNETTGAVTLVGAGTTTITATAAATTEYNSATASYELTVNAAQGGGSTGPVTITLDCTSQPFTTNIPSGSSNAIKGPVTYTDKAGYTWTIESTSGFYVNSGYLMCKYTSYITLPVVDGKKLTSVSLYCNSGASTGVKYTIIDKNNTVVGAEKSGVSDKTTALTWTLSNTTASAAYRIKIASKNGQITKLVLTYE